MKSCRFLLAVVCLAFSSIAFGQATTASLTGVVDDPSKAVIQKVSITAINTDTGAKTQTFTNKEGQYVFPALQTGNYRIEVDKQGFKGIIEAGLTLHVQDVLQLNFHMAVGSMSESVTVQANQLATTTGTVSTVIDRTMIENMPLNGKDLTTLFELSPGTILNAGGSPENGGGFSVDGQRPTANYLTIDGASGEAYVSSAGGQNQTGTGIATSASGGTNGLLPVDAIEEYRMDTSTYTAENGRTPGAQIQIRTRGGTNQFHGTLFENFRNQALDDTDWFAKYNHIPQTPLRMNDFGGTLGGPILRNKLFFFVANDNLILDQPTTTTKQDVPDPSLSSQAYAPYKAFLSVFPAGNGGPDPGNPGFDFLNASYPYLVTDHTTSARIDTQLPRSISAFVRANIAPSSSFQAGYDAHGSQVNIDTYTGGLTIPLTPHLVGELTVNHTSAFANFRNFSTTTGGNNSSAIPENVPNGVNSSTDLFNFEVVSYSIGAYPNVEYGPSTSIKLTQWNISDRLTLQVGKHSIKLGSDFLPRRSVPHGNTNSYTLDVFLESSPPYTALDTGVITELIYYHYSGYPNISLSNTSLFINDDWKIARNLTINGGARWEYDPAPSVGPLGTLAVQGSSLAPASIQASVSNKPLYSTRYDNIAPRLGFAWTPFKQQGSTTVVRGGFGVYFDTGQAATMVGTQSGAYPYASSRTFSTPMSYATTDWAGLASTAYSLPEATVYVVDPSLLSPRTYEWSLTLEQQLSKGTKLSTSYVGNDGEKLIGYERTYNAVSASDQYPVNPNLVSKNGSLYILANQSHSNYQALQLQLTTRIGERFTALGSYTWAHAEDNGSTDFSSVGAAALNPLANSAYDIRHLFGAAIHYTSGAMSHNRIIRGMTNGWAVDTIARLQSALPFTVTVSDPVPTSFLANADVVPGQPTVLHQHVDSYGKMVPGNKLLNWAAFVSPPTNSSHDLLQQGNSPTNGYRLFGLAEWDLAVSRSWRIWERLNLNFRIDAFNIPNAANFAAVNGAWATSNASTFGRATNTYAASYGSTPSSYGQTGSQLSVFQNGGPRDVQLSMKLKF